jgi:hypothetical protein
VFSLDAQRYLSRVSNIENCHSPGVSYYGLPRSFLVLIREINMFFLEKLRLRLEYDRYDVTDVDVFIVFYHTKTTSDT